MDEYKIGDRVKLIKDYDQALKGSVGTIIELKIGLVGIKFDKQSSRYHSCDGRCESDEGYYVNMNSIMKLNNYTKKQLNEKIKKIIIEIKINKDFSSCFKNVKKEVNDWDENQIINYKLDKNGKKEV